MGIAGFFGNIHIPESMITLGLPVMLMATFIFIIIARDREIIVWDGWMAVLFYALFIEKLFKLF